jgi:hypothetical protein
MKKEWGPADGVAVRDGRSGGRCPPARGDSDFVLFVSFVVKPA